MSRGRSAQIREKTEQRGKRTKEQKLGVTEMSISQPHEADKFSSSGDKSLGVKGTETKENIVCEVKK